MADDDREIGGIPEPSFASPWAVHSPRREVHSPRREDFVAWQGRVDDTLVKEVVDGVVSFIDRPAEP